MNTNPLIFHCCAILTRVRFLEIFWYFLCCRMPRFTHESGAETTPPDLEAYSGEGRVYSG